MNNSNRLSEWLNAQGNKVILNNNSTTTSAKQGNNLFKDSFMKLVRYLDAYYYRSSVNYISECELDVSFGTGADKFNLDIDVNSVNIRVVVQTADTVNPDKIVDATVDHNEWSKVLSILEENNIIKNKKFCESVRLSTIDEFKPYEGLWD